MKMMPKAEENKHRMKRPRKANEMQAHRRLDECHLKNRSGVTATYPQNF